MSFTSRVASIFQGQREGIPASVGKDPRDLTQKARFDRLPNTVANILINDNLDATDQMLAAKKFINRHGYKAKNHLSLNADPDRLDGDIMRNIAAIILVSYIPEKNGFDEDFLDRELHLKPQRAKELVLAILYALSTDRPLYQAFVNNNIDRLQAMFPGFFDNENAM